MCSAGIEWRNDAAKVVAPISAIASASVGKAFCIISLGEVVWGSIPFDGDGIGNFGSTDKRIGWNELRD